MQIAVDVDGVLAERVPAVLDLIHDRYGVSFALDEITDWEVTVPQTGKRVPDFFAETDRDPEHVLGLSPVGGAAPAMRALAEEHELLIATYRRPEAREPTMRWLERHGIPFDGYVKEVGENKRNVDADTIIDDSLPTVRAFARERGRAVLFRRPWNADESPPENAVAAESWEEVLGHLGARSASD